ncbi:hypothetical protein AALP_AA2G157900 [Arabis alpina]|uniref:RING-type domain-containing protein n=1 Tax=Arabis alpina TaxID=50452 RepID=A0A087HHS0_ARAAL|nr:hypothetical protein AALP_AA2G157900 [Arabis alpina]
MVKDENSENLVDSWIETQNINKNKIRLPKREAFSLVQIWEARLNRSNGGNSPNQSTSRSTRSDSGVSSVQDSHIDQSEIVEAKNLDSTVDTESDSGDSKSGRVADLVRRLSKEKKLTAGENGGCSGDGGLTIIRTPRPCISSCSSSEKSNFPVVCFSPRLRGRQAFTDLLMQLERDRHRELETLLERNAVSRFTQRGRLQSMLRLRNLNRCLAIQDRNLSNDHYQSAKANKETEVTRETTRLKKGGVTLEAFFAERLHVCDRKIEEEATLCKEKETVNGPVESGMNCLQVQETIEAEETYNDGESEKKEEEKTSPSVCVIQELRLRQNQNEKQETPETQGVVHESNEIDQCLEQQETSYLNGWEEQEEYEDEQSYYGETNNDWLNEISRPRSYWEELRKSRYLEVMNTRSEKEDIRRLLERRTVTDFLESGLREKIDSLMMSRVQTHSNKHSEKWELQEDEEEEKNEIEEDIEEEEHNDRDDSSRSSSSHMFASSPAGSWSSQDTEVTSPPVLSIHTPHSSPEMDMISGMRSQIQQLQQEMALLRDSVKMCLDANASLQHSVHRENPMKRKCCVCDETQVEAVLYKCGHMCTCLKCANELHCSGGKCPICRAQIMDVNVLKSSLALRNLGVIQVRGEVGQETEAEEEEVENLTRRCAVVDAQEPHSNFSSDARMETVECVNEDALIIFSIESWRFEEDLTGLCLPNPVSFGSSLVPGALEAEPPSHEEEASQAVIPF